MTRATRIAAAVIVVVFLLIMTGAVVGYTLALAHVSTERVEQIEGHAESDAAMRVALARSVAWAEAWRALAIGEVDARVGPLE